MIIPRLPSLVCLGATTCASCFLQHPAREQVYSIAHSAMRLFPGSAQPQMQYAAQGPIFQFRGCKHQMALRHNFVKYIGRPSLTSSGSAPLAGVVMFRGFRQLASVRNSRSRLSIPRPASWDTFEEVWIYPQHLGVDSPHTMGRCSLLLGLMGICNNASLSPLPGMRPAYLTISAMSSSVSRSAPRETLFRTPRTRYWGRSAWTKIADIKS